MAYAQTTNTITTPGIRATLARPFLAIWNVLLMIAEHGPRMDEVRKLNATSDEELAARGLTRASEVQRIFGHRMYL
ncbi:DUF1127 domain-containing protein [Szabonella alba]|uniref:DUF1127 domain-containing protein n=1 Tax=Szabonella alba TaxID=2804194 RepID=A0A8K0XZS4_9RHOB|nr:DUF1127 domain-containing protein [Szabonella alba]MBL4917101.1 DUF1127 domain-containing protein [Szabonella alba]